MGWWSIKSCLWHDSPNGIREHAPPENYENLDSRKHVFLDFGAKIDPIGGIWNLELFPVNTDKQISHNKASVN